MPDFARPQSMTEAVRLLSDGGWRMLAGGTDLYPGAGMQLAGAVLDLGGVPQISGIEIGEGLRIGAATPWAVVAEAALPAACRALQQAARQVGGRQVQAAGTIGGNLCNASPAADGVPPLMALEAEVEMVSARGVRRLPLQGLLLGPRRTALQPDEMLAAVVIPETALRGHSAFVKLGARSHLVISIVMVAVRVVVEDGRLRKASIAVGSCSPVAVRLPAVEAALVGVTVDEAVGRVLAADVQSALSPIDDVRATAAYRRVAAVELVHRALREALA